MAEKLTLSVPQSLTDYSILSVEFYWDQAHIIIKLQDNTGKKIVATYNGSVATTLMTQLNKVDLSTNSLQKRIFNQLINDGKIPTGNVTGTPD